MNVAAGSTDKQPATDRLVSLDQFRGYTVAGMFLVNYFSHSDVCPQVLRHTHDYVSYADTIMPQFLFAVGFSLRLTFGRRMQTQGSAAAYFRMIRRLLGLVLVSLVVYTVGARAATWQQLQTLGFWGAIADPLKHEWFQTLMHIAVTSFWILPVVHLSSRARWSWLIFSALLHVVLSYWFNFTWVNTNPSGIDGGPLGFLTWTIPAIIGTLACDVFVPSTAKLPSGAEHARPSMIKPLILSAVLMALGYAFSCGTRLYDVPESQVTALSQEKLASDPVLPTSERINAKLASGGWNAMLAEPPFVPPPHREFETVNGSKIRKWNSSDYRKWNYWMMSQRGGTLSYLTFSAGFSLLIYVIFYVLGDIWRVQIPVFRTFGKNALLGYVLHSMVGSAVQPFVPKDAPHWYAYSALAVFFLINWLILRSFEKQGMFPRV